uniref:Fibroblast growth factor n=1 Tax=Sparus aurata TaxID=8175 RepID=A0A671V723_SPAAU
MFYIHFSGIHFIVTECRNLLVGIFYFLYGTRVEHTALTFPLRLNNPASKQQIICVLAHFVPINFCLFSPVKLQLQATSVGEVVIKGVCANRYLAMNRDGRLFGARRATDECHFLERLESNNYNTYRSRKYPNMYVALKRTGQYKSGSKTGPGQKAILFLPMSAKC